MKQRRLHLPHLFWAWFPIRESLTRCDPGPKSNLI